MLVLGRKEMETIRIGDDIRVTIVAIGPNYVRVGIDAPRQTPIHRQEVYERIHKTKEKKNDDN